MPVRAFIGRCGSGKTYSMQRLVAESLRATRWRFLVLDLNSEWPNGPAMGAVRWSLAHDEQQAAAFFKAGARLVVVRPKEPPGSPVPWAGLADRLAALTMQTRGVILCLPEVHQSGPEGRPLPPSLAALVTRYRHTKCGIWFDTQRLAAAHNSMLDASQATYFFAMPTRGIEGKKLRDIGGPALVDAVHECANRVRNGVKGYFVRVEPIDTHGPFPIRRL